MNRFRRICSIVLTAALALSLLPISAPAAVRDAADDSRVIRSVLVGQTYSAVLTKGGAVWYWGTDSTPKKVITSGVTSIAGGSSHVLALTEDGSVLSWGANTQGQLGDGTATTHSTPAQVKGMDSGVVCISASNTISLAVKEDGSVWVWGSTGDYLAGPDQGPKQLSPVQVSNGLPEISQASIGGNFALALDRSGSLWVWGNNSYGQYGDGTSGSKFNTGQAKQVSAQWSAGEIRTFAAYGVVSPAKYVAHVITQDGTLWQWGGPISAPILTPQEVQLPEQVTGVQQVGYGANCMHFLDSDGTLWTQGNSGDGSSGNMTYPEPTAVLEDVALFSATPGGNFRSSALLAVKTDGTLWRRDYDHAEFYQIEGGWEEEYVPPLDPEPDAPLPEPESGVVSLWAGDSHTVALCRDGSLWGWGSNSSGQLGLESGERDSLVPRKLMDDVVSAAADSWYTMAVKSDGTLWAWGSNSYGQFGDGTTESSMTPKQIMDGVSKVYAEEQRTLILKTDGTLWECGECQPYPQQGAYGPVQIMERVDQVWQNGSTVLATDTNGALWLRGTLYNNTSGNAAVSYEEPTRILDGGVACVAAGTYHTIVVMKDGTVRAWGNNQSGELGDGTTATQTSPVNVSEANPAFNHMVSAVCGAYGSSFLLRQDGYLWTMGRYRWNNVQKTGTLQIMDGVKAVFQNISQDTLVLKRDGTLLGWNYYGQSSGSTTRLANYNEPTQILTGVYDVFLFSNQAYAVKSDGTLWAWGDNSSGQLGDGTETARTTPVQIVLDENWEPEPSEPVEVPVVRVAAGYDHSLAVRTDGTLWSWGSNSRGQLGNGTTSSAATSKPQQVAGLTNVAAVAAGQYHSAALQQGGVLWTWGDNSSGQLGTNTTVNSSVPVRIMDGVVKVDAGPLYTMALKADGTLWIWGYAGSMGYGNQNNYSYRPTQIMSDVKDFSAGKNAIGVVTNSGELWLWGNRSAIGVAGDDIFDWINDPVEENATRVAYSGVESVSVGSDYVMYITTGSSLYARGTDHYGETGTGAHERMESPVFVTSGVKSVQAGIYTSTMIKTDGTLWACGMLDINSPISGLQMTPTKWMDAPVSDADLSFGATLDEYYGHGLLVQGDLLYTWGGNLSGQLGNGTTSYVRSPRAIMYIIPKEASLSGTVTISGRPRLGETLTSNTFSVTSDIGSTGALSLQWLRDGIPVSGATEESYLLTRSDIGKTITLRVTAASCAGELISNAIGPVVQARQVKAVALGTGHGLAILEDDTLWAWGRNDGGQLGIGNQINQPQPVPVMEDVSAVAASGTYSMAIKKDGSLWAWGSNFMGQLGDGTTTMRLTPVKIMDNVKKVSLGANHAMALKTDGTLWTWGGNTFGQLGDQTSGSRPWPAQITRGSDNLVIRNVTDIAAGDGHSLAKLSSGNILGWGTSLAVNGEFYANGYYPIPIPVITRTNSAMAAGTSHSLYCVDIAGWNIYGYGDNSSGQLGNGTTDSAFGGPAITKNLTSVSALLASGKHSAAINTSGNLYAWGDNSSGQLGTGGTTDQSYPISLLSNVTSAALSSKNSAAIKTDGSLWIWGDNTYGQLGDGTTEPSYSPKELVFVAEVLPEDTVLPLQNAQQQEVGTLTISYETAQRVNLTANLTGLEPPAGSVLYLATYSGGQMETIRQATFSGQTACLKELPAQMLKGSYQILLLDPSANPLTRSVKNGG